ncbi:hypothetical protein R3W88_005663 [Solanum pinnatisectum]|uniref:AP2/ERF domain-containing protein n=1 Tax=Solanum pinnatisectum TaxID=50273 RepID=A0AAV9KET9_9SOLN|nr:hypothetical protein R3W88_005663 [Solanum pinnatisectum]
MTPQKNNKAIVNLEDDDEVHFKGVWKLPCGSYTTEIRHPDQKRNIWLGSARTYDTAARKFGGHTVKTNFPPVYLQTTTRDFLCKINHNNVTSDHVLPNQSRNIASSSRSSSDAVSFPLLNQNPKEFRRFKTVTGTSVVMSTACDKDLLETLMKAGVILPDPKMKETLDFMGVGPVQPRTASVEPPNLELSLAPPGNM